MPVGIDPISNPQAYDYARIGGVTTPLCRVSGFKRPHEWDQKKGKGALGATITFIQRPPAKGTLTLILVTSADFALWYTIIPALKYDPTKKAPQPVDIYHPALADIDLASVVTENIGIVEHKGDGLYEVEIELLEYFPPPNASAVSTPQGSTTTLPPPGQQSPGNQPPNANAAQMAEIQALLNQAGAP